MSSIDADLMCLTQYNCNILMEIAAKTTTLLNEKQEHLKTIKWTDSEANPDSGFSELACKCAEEAWLFVQQHYPALLMITLVAVKPDINCIFSKNGKAIEVPKNKIELKSSKGIRLPGSTIRNVDINQPLIYCHRPKKPDGLYTLRWGQYHDGMVPNSDTDLFQDRSPRPALQFNKLFTSTPTEIIYKIKEKDDWISRYGKCAVRRLQTKVKPSWQDPLTKSIIFEAIKDIETLEELHKLRESMRPTLL